MYNGVPQLPMFCTAEQMAEVTGIGASTIRALMTNQEIDFLQIGNRRLLTEQAFWNWYERVKILAKK